jgi:hypothetical protein
MRRLNGLWGMGIVVLALGACAESGGQATDASVATPTEHDAGSDAPLDGRKDSALLMDAGDAAMDAGATAEAGSDADATRADGDASAEAGIEAGNDAPDAIETGNDAPDATEAGNDAPDATEAGNDAPDATEAGNDAPDAGADEFLCSAHDAAALDEAEPACTTTGAFDRLTGDAEKKAAGAYLPPAVVACPELDRPPPPADPMAPGLVFDEYSHVIDGTAENFDTPDGIWWQKALPRGELHVQPMALFGRGCQEVSYAAGRYHYDAATPPIGTVPTCGQHLVGLMVGHQVGVPADYPGILQLEGTAYARLIPLRPGTRFGTSFRFLTEDATYASETFPVIPRVEIVDRTDTTLTFVGRIRGRTVEGAFEVQLTPADGAMKVTMRLFPRAGAACAVDVGLAALGSMFWQRDPGGDMAGHEAHDADFISVGFDDGTHMDLDLQNPSGPDDGKTWERRSFTKTGAHPSWFTLVQKVRDPEHYKGVASAEYDKRPDLRIDLVSANVPVEVELAMAHASDEYIDNVVARLRIAPGSAPLGNLGRIDLTYTVTASMP